MHNRLPPPSSARSFRQSARRAFLTIPTSRRLEPEQATPPSRATLATIACAVRQFSDDGLQELRRRFVEEREHRLILDVIDVELQRRDGSSGPQRA